MSARIEPGGVRELGPVIWAFSRIAGRTTKTEPPAIFTTLGRGRGLDWGWLHFAGTLMPGGKLPRRETELVILRVAHRRGCRYEFDHHVHLSRRAGVTAADVYRVVAGPDAEGWTAREGALLAAADGLVADGDLDDDAWDELRRHLGEREAIELVLLAAHYAMLATFMNTLRVQPDRPRRRRG